MSSNIPWIVLSYTLAAGLILFIILWTIEIDKHQTVPVCPSGFMLVPGVDLNALTVCGTTKSQTCTFAKGSLLACQQECDLQPDVCKAFTFNQSTSTMKIVDPSGIQYSSSNSNLFLRN